MISRRQFLLHTSAAALAFGLPVAIARPVLAQDGPADRIFLGGPILTMNDALPRAEAVAIKNAIIVAVGTRDEVLTLQDEGTIVTELDGRALIPGFVDAHGHVAGGGLQALSANLLAPPDGDVTDIASLQSVLRQWMEVNRAAVEATGFVVGFGYDPSQLAEQRHPTREDLDAVTTDLPIFLVHQSGHMAASNSRMLELAGLTATTPEPVGGVIRRRPDGSPDGVLEEAAMYPVFVGVLGQIGPDGFKAMIRAGADLWARYGYTTAEEGRTIPAMAALFRQIAAEGGLPIDVVGYQDAMIGRDEILASQSRIYDNRFRIGGAKLVIDGSPQGFTAYRDRPYVDPVGDYAPGWRGYMSLTEEQVHESIDWCFANGVQVMTHSNGEAAHDVLIAAVDVATRKHGPADRRPVLIHGQFLREDQVNELKRLDIFPSLFPMHTFYWGDWHRDHTVGPQLADNISPTGWCVERGMMFSSHHDAPVAFPDSMRVLDATVTRRTRSGDILGPEQRVDVTTALKAMTIWPAWSHFEEATKGSIEVGKLADLVILSDDPTAVDPDTLDRMTVAETIKEGATVYLAGEKEGRLNFRPTPHSDPLSEFVRQAAVHSEMGLLGEGSQGTGARRFPLRAIANGPQHTACVARFLQNAMAASLSGTQSL